MLLVMATISCYNREEASSMFYYLFAGGHMIETLIFIFNVCIGLGLAIPLISVALGFFGSILNTDFDIGGESGADTGIPINIMCLCFSFVVFGAFGRLLASFIHGIIASVGILLGLILLSYGSYLLVYKYVVKPLQKNNANALTQWDLFGTKGKLTLRIAKDSPGTVSLKDSTGALISYVALAKDDVLSAWDGIIPQGADVIVIDVGDSENAVYVNPLDTLENHKLRIK
jgi:hypothetical protein